MKGDIFIPKSALNAFRRDFYAKLSETIAKNGNTFYEYTPFIIENSTGANDKTAVIATDFDGVMTDIAIYKAYDYSAPLCESFKDGNFEKYLFYPAFATEKDLLALQNCLKETKIDGIYAENYGGIAFAKAHGLKVFAGTGLNLTNSLSIASLLQEQSVVYYALSKELNMEELSALKGQKAFALSSGGIKIMELCYCPFGKTCRQCDKKSIYTLTDEGGRVFPVRRYLSTDGACRFEVYNCAYLVGVGGKNIGKLLDLTLAEDKTACFNAKDDEQKQKQAYRNYTSGHYKRGLL